MLHTITVKSSARQELRDITAEVVKLVRSSGVKSGLCHLYVPHTTAAVAINENDDPAVGADIESVLRRLFPQNGPYQHLEGNADAHIKATLVGASQSVPIENGALELGRWQGIFFCEFDGPRQRQVKVKIIASP